MGISITGLPLTVEDGAFANWGPLVTEFDVDTALIAVLKTWMPTYVTQMNTERGRDFSAPKSYQEILSEDEWLDGQTPGILCTTAKTRQVKGGASSPYEVRWTSTVSVIIRGRSPMESHRNASLYNGTIRRCLLQKGRTNPPTGDDLTIWQQQLADANTGILSECVWDGSQVGFWNGDTRQGRYLSVGIGTYTVVTDKAATADGGPNVPNAAPYTDGPEITSVTFDVEPESLTGEG